MSLKRTFWVLVLSIAFSMRAHAQSLQSELDSLAAISEGRLGVCVLTENDSASICVRGGEAFPLQSVMKLIVGASILDAVDRKELKLGDRVELTPDDVSPGPEEFANIIKQQRRYTATIEELIRRSIVDSDSTAVDALLNHAGGIAAVQSFIKRKAISGVRVDRTERELQTESVGLPWNADYSDLKEFDEAVESLSVDIRDKAWNVHLRDHRDKATPEGMVGFLRALMEGRLLSVSSTEKLLSIMSQTATGKDRLRSGLLPGWKIAHKTGTGRTWKGETETANDVGIVTAPDGRRIAVAVFLARSSAAADHQASIIARVAGLLCNHYDLARR